MKENKEMFSLIREPDIISKEYYLEELGLDSLIVKLLKDNLLVGNLGELLEKDICFIDEALKNSGYATRDLKTEIRRAMHKKGLVLKNEFSHLGISDELAMVPIWELKIRANTSNTLLKKDIYVLGDLLSLTSSRLTELLNEEMTLEIIECLNNLGLSLSKESINKRR